jgi:hypothetical protein
LEEPGLPDRLLAPLGLVEHSLREGPEELEAMLLPEQLPEQAAQAADRDWQVEPDLAAASKTVAAQVPSAVLQALLCSAIHSSRGARWATGADRSTEEVVRRLREPAHLRSHFWARGTFAWRGMR